MAASRDRPPERTLTAVRAIAAVAGMPPNSGVTRFAIPWPNSSRSASWRSPTLIPSATVADIKLSSAANAATAIAGTSKLPTVPGWIGGRLGVGRPAGISPIVSSATLATAAMTLAATMATSETGNPGRRRAARAMTATTEPETASGAEIRALRATR